MKFSQNATKTAIGVVFFSLLIFGAGFYYGNIHEQQYGNNANILQPESDEEVDFSAFWKAWEILNQKFVSNAGTASSTVASSTSNQERVYGAIEGMTESLGDPYTTFLSPTENEIFSGDIRGEFGGVGMEIGQRDGVLTVISPLKGTPAERAGLKPGDKIIGVDGETTEEESVQSAVQKIRGEVGTTVTLSILSEDEQKPREVEIERATIEVPTIETSTQEDTFVIALYNFSAKSPELFQEAVEEFQQSGLDKMVLDLRGNAGGYLQAAVEVASFFVEEGKVIVREDFGSKRDSQVHRSKGYDLISDNTKVAVLVNGGSASAAEIVAGALSDHEVAQLVGTQTFGKGSVQELIELTEDTSLKVTVARWMTPDNTSISDGGLTPGTEVELSEDGGGDDEQLNKAIEILQ